MKNALKHIIWIVFLTTANGVWAQESQQMPLVQRYRNYNQAVFNWGLKIGLNATSVTHFNVFRDGEELTNTSYRNKSGYSITAFCRINLDRFLLQPEAGWSLHNKDLFFTLPSEEVPNPPRTQLSLNTHTVDVNALIGYNITRTGPFVFNVITGMAFRYKLKTTYHVPPDNRYWDTEPAYDLFTVFGFSTNISAVHFDIRYEISILNTHISFDDMPEKPDILHGVTFHKNENILSFSCGFMF